MDRRRFITLGTVGGAALLTGCTPPPQDAAKAAASPPAGGGREAAPPTFKFSLNALDGYAYLFAGDRSRLVLAGIDTPGLPHKLLLRVRSGTPSNNDHQTPDPAFPEPQYDLTGFETTVGFDGPGSPLELPVKTTLPGSLPCPVPPTDFETWNNLGFLPDAAAIYSDATLRHDWASHVHSTLILDRGAISVSPGVPGLWHFHTETERTDRVAQQMSDRISIGVPAATGNTVRLNVRKNAAQQFTVEIAPAGGVVILDLAIKHAIPPGSVTPHPPNQPIMHFGRFAKLFVKNEGGHERELKPHEIVFPFLEECKSGDKTPGDFCPFIQAILP